MNDEKQKIIKYDQDNNKNDQCSTHDIPQLIRKTVQQKRNLHLSDDSKAAGNQIKAKFIFEIDAQQNENEYSYGVRFYYWKYYQHMESKTDDAHQMASAMFDGGQPVLLDGSNINEWYISKKFYNLKAELTNNPLCNIPASYYIELITAASTHIKSDLVKSMICPRKGSAACYDMQPDQLIDLNHLIAIMVYCNCTQLQRAFSETYRHKDKYESDSDMKDRHRNYYYLGRYLRECVECFGMKWKNLSDKNITVYHGVNKIFTFPSLFAYINGPLSTTTDFSVAGSFSEYKGMIVTVNIKTSEWRYKWDEGIEAFQTLCLFDCQPFSDFTNEQEIFTIGGSYKLMFKSIVDYMGNNYSTYIQGIKQMLYNTSNGGYFSSIDEIANTAQQTQMVFRLLSHELSRCSPNHQHAHEFKSCPDYIKDMVHTQCLNVLHITFNNREYESKIHELLFKSDNGWIKLELIGKLFLNVSVVLYDATNMDIGFLKNASIYESTLAYIKDNKHSKLEDIQIEIDSKHIDIMQWYLMLFSNDFHALSWHIYVHVKNDKYINEKTSDKFDVVITTHIRMKYIKEKEMLQYMPIIVQANHE
eukprot:362243_1